MGELHLLITALHRLKSWAKNFGFYRNQVHRVPFRSFRKQFREHSPRACVTNISNDGSGEEPDKAESEESVCAVATLDASLGNIWFVESDHWPIKYSPFKSPTNSIKAISTRASAFAFPVFHFWECERGLSTSPGIVSFSALITS